MTAAYEQGYTDQMAFLDGKTVAEAEHVLEQRRATADDRNPHNRGATAATEAYIAERQDV